MKFGMLTALERLRWDEGDQRTIWRCLCDCGTTHDVALHNLVQGRTRSCGCLRRQAGGYSQTPEYEAWRHLGVKGQRPAVWAKFPAFLADVGERVDNKHALLRLDVRKPHGPGNSYWGKRRPRNKMSICVDGTTDSKTGWCLRLSIWPYDVKKRMEKLGCDTQGAIESFVKEREKR
jgi:hypothetical protein